MSELLFDEVEWEIAQCLKFISIYPASEKVYNENETEMVELYCERETAIIH